MNKKFSTLLASFLLAGGLFSTADAIDLTKAASGTYYDLTKNAEFKGAWINADNSVLCKAVQIEVSEDGKAVRFKKNGTVLTYEQEKGTFQWFTVKYCEAGESLTANGDVMTKDANKLTFKFEDHEYVLTSIDDKGKLVFAESGTGANYIAIDAEEVPCTIMSAEDLNYYEEDGFSLTIKGLNDAETAWNVSLKDNFFTGHLTPVYFNDEENKFKAATTQDGPYYLKNSNGKYIVVKADLAEGDVKDAYAFAEITEAELRQDINTEDKHKYFTKFQFCVAPTVDPKTATYIHEINVYKNDGETLVGKVGRLDFKNEAYLAVENTIELKPVQIKLGSDQIADWKKVLEYSFFTVKNLKTGAVRAAVDCREYADVASVANVLEAQWALTFADGEYKFVNRENQSVQFTIKEDALYEVGTADDYIYSWKGVNWEIKPVETTDADGYTRLGTPEELLNKRFNIAFSSNVFGANAYFTEEHMTDHTIGLSTDVETASVWQASVHADASKLAKYNTNTYQYENHPTDSIYVISTLQRWNASKGKSEYVQDTLKVVTYSFVNQYGEELIYNWNTRKFTAGNASPYITYYFALREEKGKLNLRLLNAFRHDSEWYSTQSEAINAAKQDPLYWNAFAECGSKMYAGDTEDGLLAITGLYERTENDLFVIEETDKPMYRTLVNDLDTVSIYRDENASQLLYEDGKFLGLKNENQFEIAPAMLADAAYAPEGAHRPLYMLAVGTTIVPNGKWCATHETSDCEHATETKGWVEGRYLINLKDTAIAWHKAHKHTQANPYVNSEGYYRFGFVDATHRNDSLIFANGKKIYVANTNNDLCKFAFRYVDQETGSFVIEAARYYGLSSVGTSNEGKLTSTQPSYLKWMNGVVVAVDNLNDADVFNMNEEEDRTPTANEEIAAEGVTVIAGNGNVTIAGAAGKKVVIANILGQTVANTVLTSDNATIAAPAGVVVVKVEGEAAVKAIVK